MKKDISHHRYRLATSLIGSVVLLSCSFLNQTIVYAKENDAVQETVRCITDKQLEKLYTCKDEVINDTCLVISVEDAELLMKIAHHEDHTDALSQAYIMSEVLNRVDSPDFPNTIKEVLNQEGQFLSTDSNEFKSVNPDVNSHLALALIESRAVQTDFLFHEATDSADSWASRNREVALEYGGTRFYK